MKAVFYQMSLIVSLLILPLSLLADPLPWEGLMQDGSRISIDPQTNKASRSAQGESQPLWDGVHQLDNGAVIIVRDGVVVMDAALLESHERQQREMEQVACMQLVRKVCGIHNECQKHPACDPARQLLSLEKEELSNRGLNPIWQGVELDSRRLCLDALNNENYFQVCTKRRSTNRKSPCQALQKQVCGSRGQCARTQACDAARQLLGMEREELVQVPSGLTQSGAECREAMEEGRFFKPCE
jgi:hypothetical protein